MNDDTVRLTSQEAEALACALADQISDAIQGESVIVAVAALVVCLERLMNWSREDAQKTGGSVELYSRFWGDVVDTMVKVKKQNLAKMQNG